MVLAPADVVAVHLSRAPEEGKTLIRAETVHLNKERRWYILVVVTWEISLVNYLYFL